MHFLHILFREVEVIALIQPFHIPRYPLWVSKRDHTLCGWNRGFLQNFFNSKSNDLTSYSADG
jgi:hypothetical protein